MTQPNLPVASHSVWSPLRRPLFRNRLIASVISNTGSWMQDTAGAWLMTALTTSPLLIALMQTAASLPVLLLGLPAGATADILDVVDCCWRGAAGCCSPRRFSVH
jgi:hypothetical protein